MREINTANETPGKADDFLLAAECFSESIAKVFKHARENYIDPDGTFQDIKFVEFRKWLPIVRYVAGEAQTIAEECFGADATPEVKNEILRIILGFLGVRLDDADAGFLSKILNQ